jgi:hypothetical protein
MPVGQFGNTGWPDRVRQSRPCGAEVMSMMTFITLCLISSGIGSSVADVTNGNDSTFIRKFNAVVALMLFAAFVLVAWKGLKP